MVVLAIVTGLQLPGSTTRGDVSARENSEIVHNGWDMHILHTVYLE